MIEHLKLERIKYRAKSTLGILECGNFECFTLELPWLGNRQNISCISEGLYKWKKRFSPGKQYEVIELIGVPNRSYIQIHRSNYTRQILGCIAPGLGLRDIDKDGIFDVTHSEQAFDRIMAMTADSGTIDIVG